MTAYTLQRAIFDFLRARENGLEADPVDFAHGLSPKEEAALRNCDLVALVELGVHRVLASGFARENGVRREDYRHVFKSSRETAAFPERSVPWRP